MLMMRWCSFDPKLKTFEIWPTPFTNWGKSPASARSVSKCAIAPIRCANMAMDPILQDFLAERVEFPIKYLGLPLSLTRLKKVDMQFILDKTATKIAPWQGKFFNLAGRASLVKSTLTALPIQLLTALKVDKGIIKSLNKQFRSFI